MRAHPGKAQAEEVVPWRSCVTVTLLGARTEQTQAYCARLCGTRRGLADLGYSSW